MTAAEGATVPIPGSCLMSHEADTVAERPTGAQTVAPVQASALLFAASILGEGSYTPEQELKGR